MQRKREGSSSGFSEHTESRRPPLPTDSLNQFSESGSANRAKSGPGIQNTGCFRMKVGASHLQAPSLLAGKLAKSPNQMATCGQIIELPDSECIYDNKLFHHRKRRWWANKSVQKCCIQKASGCLTGRRTPHRQLSINRPMGADCCVLQTAWSHVDVNGHLNSRNQMDLKELTERKHPTAKAVGMLQGRMGTDWKARNKLIFKINGFYTGYANWKNKKSKKYLKLLSCIGD